MVKRLLTWLKGTQTVPLFPAIKIPEYTPEERAELLATLASHPGFELLVSELHNRRLLVETHRPSLKTPRSLDDLIYNAVEQTKWDAQRAERGWLETQVVQSVLTATPEAVAEAAKRFSFQVSR